MRLRRVIGHRWRRSTAAAVVLLGIAAVVLPLMPRRAATAERGLNVLLMTLDTTRADRLAAYGDARAAATPGLDRLAQEGVLFEDATSPVPLTLPAHATMFTGQLPPKHGIRENFGRLDGAALTLATVLRARGYRTAAFVGSHVLARSHGLNRGFELYDDDIPWPQALEERPRRRADIVIDRALGWIAATTPSSPFFAWLHFYDAHAPYEAMSPFDRAEPGRPYEAAIASIDAQVGRLRAFLDRSGLTERTLIVVIGDHGEGLGEHGERTHGLFVYQSVLRVPFIIRAPIAAMQGRRVRTPVSSADVLPTVLDLVGAESVGSIDGRSLVSAILHPSQDAAVDIYAENLYLQRQFGWSEMRAIRSDRFKLIQKTRPELYDLDKDPGETHELSAELPLIAARLAGRLEAWHRSLADGMSEPPRTPITADVRNQMASLGYVADSEPFPVAEARAASDPRDHVALFNCLSAPRHRGDQLVPDRLRRSRRDARGPRASLNSFDIRSCR
jgi:arylsulfatase A-like enzyme